MTSGSNGNWTEKTGGRRGGTHAAPRTEGRSSRQDASQEAGRAPKRPASWPQAPRHQAPRRRRKLVPVVAAAATLAAGAATYLVATTGGHPAAGAFTAAAVNVPSDGYTVSGGAMAVGHPTVDSSTKATGKTAASKPASTKARASATPHATAKSTATPAATPRQAVAATPKASSTATATTVTCNTSYSMLPQNVTAIVSFLLAHGYSDNAAAGIAGNMYQESGGNPESVGDGGGGLIGFTPLPAGYVTGNPATDLQTQLNAVLTFNQGWSQYLPALNSAATPADAASIYVTDFERAGIPAAANREAAATNVAAACGI
ncbi:MAG TPA: phage tail tip lysozyme [Trebonia sp.]|nr:phage tail tip lysozyme [Trebonia sp.]